MPITHTRELQIDATRASDEDRTAPAVLSTEYPVTRDFGDEILSHDPFAVDLSRSPLPLLVQHNGTELNVGVVEGLRVVGKKLRGMVRLGNSARAAELWSDIKAGVLRSLSIGYLWQDYEQRSGAVVVTRWQPYEASLVSVPADPGAGLYRSNDMTTETKKRETLTVKKADADIERERTDALRKIGDEYGFRQMAVQAIEAGWNPDMLRGAILNARSVTVRPQMDPDPLQQSEQRDEPRIRMIGSKRNLVGIWGENRAEAERNAFTAGQWIRGMLFNDSKAQRWLRENTATRAMSEGIFTAGGATVPTELSSAIIVLADEFGIARQYAKQWPMASDTLAIPRRNSGVTGYYVGENTAITASDMSLDNVNLVARKYAALIRFSTELAEDAVIDIASLLSEDVARTFAEAEDDALFNGDGSSTFGGIVGVRPKLVDGSHTEGAVDATSGVDTFAEVTTADLDNVMAKLPTYARKGAKWYVSPEADALIFQSLAAATGGVTMMERGGVILKAYGGYEIVISDKMPTSATNGEAMLLFGDMSQAVAMGVRRDMRVRVDESRYAEYDQLALIATERFDVVAHDLGDNTSAGPIVGLIANT